MSKWEPVSQEWLFLRQGQWSYSAPCLELPLSSILTNQESGSMMVPIVYLLEEIIGMITSAIVCHFAFVAASQGRPVGVTWAALVAVCLCMVSGRREAVTAMLVGWLFRVLYHRWAVNGHGLPQAVGGAVNTAHPGWLSTSPAGEWWHCLARTFSHSASVHHDTTFNPVQ